MINEFFKRFFSSIILIPLVLFIIIKTDYLFNVFLIICFLIAAYEWHMMTKKKSYYIYGLLFLLFSFYASYKLKIYNEDYKYFLFILLICVSTDIGGYVCGKIFKGPKLGSISPKKTYAGLFGGLVFSLVSMGIFFQLSIIFDEKPETTSDVYFLIIILSLVSQSGDLLISYFKRKSKIKDTGNLIPGHGGLLDRIDGIIFALPFFYIILLSNFIKVF